MQLQGRNLEHGCQGQDVWLLQFELMLLHRFADGMGLPPIEEDERLARFFGDSTHAVVLYFQETQGLEVDGIVGRVTARYINAQLDERVGCEQRLEYLAGEVNEYLFRIGELEQEVSASDARLQECTERASSLKRELDACKHQHPDCDEQIAELEAALEAAIAERDRLDREKAGLQRELDGLHEAIDAIGRERDQLREAADACASDVEDLNTQLEQARRRIRELEQGQPKHSLPHVRGTVFSHEGIGVEGQHVVLVDVCVGRQTTLQTGETDDRGRFRLEYTLDLIHRLGKTRPDLQVHAVLGEEKSITGSSVVRYNASASEVLDVIIPASQQPKMTEFERVTAAMGRHLEVCGSEIRGFADLVENDVRQDITYLASKSGWDARLVAMMALAAQYYEKTEIPTEIFYALFRSGVAANDASVTALSYDSVESVVKTAIDQEIISERFVEVLPRYREQFDLLGAQHMLGEPPRVGISPLDALLEVGLRNEGIEFDKERIARLYYEQHGNLERFWECVKGEFNERVAQRLQLNGKLAFLSLNNADVVGALQSHEFKFGDERERNIESELDLVLAGLDQPNAWDRLLDGNPIPPEIPGENDSKRKENYAAFMASQIKLSFPTAVVGAMVGRKQIKLDKSIRNEVCDFLISEQAEFELGDQPISLYVQSMERYDARPGPACIEAIERLQRVYQVTPSDGAMCALLDAELDSALKIIEAGEEALRSVLHDDFEAKLTYAKAQQVHNVVLNVATMYMLEKTSPAVAAMQPVPKSTEALAVDEDAAGEATFAATDPIAYPTLEKLFGEMEYCGCDHCQSILSPAAYLVDLLKFIDKENEGVANPLEVLLKRRPDIQHLRLDCENTHTVLPYIDLVNEILEAFVVEGKDFSTKYEGHNVGPGMRTEELLASPEFVKEEAYKDLREAAFPLGLPFHLPLQTLRRYFARLEVPLVQAMETLLKDHRINAAGSGKPFDWQDLLIETLGISREEFAILASDDHSLAELYGLDKGKTDADVVGQFSSAKAFARQLGIRYMDTVDVVRTRFLNPGSDLIPGLELLGLSFKQIDDFARNNPSMSGSKFEELTQHVSREEIQKYFDGDAKTWVTKNYDRIMNLVVLTDPKGSEDLCSFEDVEFQKARTMVDEISRLMAPHEFLKLVRFIRLWKKLGWRMELVDKAFTALYPDETGLTIADRDDIDRNFAAFLFKLALVMMVANKLGLKPKKELTKLLSLWAPIDTQGQRSLYRQMFLNPTLIEQDAAFTGNSSGGWLTDTNVKVEQHQGILKAAFNLTQEEYDLVIGDLKYDSTTPLLLENVTCIYRYALLARSLSLSIQELIDLKKLSGIDPLGAPTYLEPDGTTFAWPDIVRYIDLAQKIDRSPFDMPEVLYFLGHRDPGGKTSPSEQELLTLAKTIRDDLLRIEKENVSTGALADSELQEKLTLIYGQGVAEDFVGLISGARPFEVDCTEAVPAEMDAALAAATDRMAYDSYRKKLQFRGVMSKALQEELTKLAAGKPKIKDAIKSLHTLGANYVAQSLGSGFPELEVLLECLMAGTTTYATPLAPAEVPKDKLGALKAMSSALQFDGSREVLLFSGIMSKKQCEDMKVAINDSPQTLAAALNALRTLGEDEMGEVGTSCKGFLDAHPEYSELAALISNHDELYQRGVLLNVFLPALRDRLKRQQTLQTIASGIGADLGTVRSIVESAAMLHAADDPARPALHDFLGLEPQGLSVQVCFATQMQDQLDLILDCEPSLDYGEDHPLPKKPAGSTDAVSGRWFGYLVPPETGFYKIGIETDAAAKVSLKLSGETISLDIKNGIWTNIDALELQAGVARAIELVVEKVSDKLRLTWERHGVARGTIPSEALLPELCMERFASGYLRLLKTIAVADGLGLKNEELPYAIASTDYATVPDVCWFTLQASTQDRDALDQKTCPAKLKTELESRLLELSDVSCVDVITAQTEWRVRGTDWTCAVRANGNDLEVYKCASWINALPVGEVPLEELSDGMLTSFMRLLRFSELKRQLDLGDERLAALLDALAKPASTMLPALSRISGWQESHIEVLMTALGMDLTERLGIDPLDQLAKVFTLVEETGLDAETLSTCTTNAPSMSEIASLQSSLRARYDERSWLKLVQEINDPLRRLQRDALVDYVLHQQWLANPASPIDTPEKLFEFFLIDVEMDSCMKTSRIKQAISSVQLFIHRCLMNLEDDAKASGLDAKQWEWMKRYRIWEANRKVFLFPENWLEPELRDNKSPFFKDLESELLESDITEESAAIAMGHYLEKLDEVAKLEVCGMHIEEHKPDDITDDVIHVIARTPGAKRAYYYRRVDGLIWSPWEKIDLEIEDNPVLPVVWNDRLFLFWASVIREPLESASPLDLPDGESEELSSLKIKKPDARASICVSVNLYWSENVNGTWLPPKTSDIGNPAPVEVFLAEDHAVFHRDKLQLLADDGTLWHEEDTDQLAIYVCYENAVRGTFTLYNTHSLPLFRDEHMGLLWTGIKRQPCIGERALQIEYVDERFGACIDDKLHIVLQATSNDDASWSMVQDRFWTPNLYATPFFYQDRRYAFFVRPTFYVRTLNLGPWLGYDLGVNTARIRPSSLVEVLPNPDLHMKLIPKELRELVRDPAHQSMVDALTRETPIKYALASMAPISYGDRLVTSHGTIAQYRDKGLILPQQASQGGDSR